MFDESLMCMSINEVCQYITLPSEWNRKEEKDGN